MLVVEFVTGNLLGADAEALVNAVNTKGVMGKGIALQFKHAYPENFKEYRGACAAGEVRLGRMLVVATGRLPPPACIINFPTKGYWKSRWRLADIDSGLRDYARAPRTRDRIGRSAAFGMWPGRPELVGRAPANRGRARRPPDPRTRPRARRRTCTLNARPLQEAGAARRRRT